ncbi:class I SAM-dependent methyltransferase [Halalkalibacter krulwichiae]|uniref:Methyltransferase domain-containing protein n=1 Tax=Halalkalibacter krulwichiae TaxID=199441 RepID=A0A1X9MHF6_9BACI|nr:class I SAM-dependent methyltransferase [Halalkalibacter krulwichiae]ARK32878.1 hypothetical protein BkAM31D_25095 [Halalkalibacter krulwichiae]
MMKDNFEEYHDPQLYDKENQQYIPELPFLLKWAARVKGTIIDLACGTGRLTIPMAENGYSLIGVDIHNGNIVNIYTISHFDTLNQVQHYTTIRKYKSSRGELVNEKRTTIKLRYVFPKEMERLLLLHGFKIIDVYRDWNGAPVTNDSYDMIYVCEKVRG